jgi:BirA family biotin operon repressor/biotin-[acetyl-CoA-carboxylase] ligase
LGVLPFSTESFLLQAGDAVSGRFFYFPELHSTNSWLLERAHELPAGSVCIAGHQTRGRGTYGRSWLVEPQANLTFSVLAGNLKPHFATLCAMQTWCEVLDVETGIPVALKWPNDLIVSGKKLGGVLTETVPGTGNTRFVVGMGVNVNQSAFPESIAAASLFTITGEMFSRETLLAQWFIRFRENFIRWTLDAHSMLQACAQCFVHVNKPVTASGIEGTFSGLSAAGMPVLMLANGTAHEITDPLIRF